MAGVFKRSLCELRYCFVACYLASSAMIVYYASKSYDEFFVEKKFMMQVAAYKISLDLVNIFDHSELTLNAINKKVVSATNKNELANVLVDAGKTYSQKVTKYELSTGKFYWIDSSNRLIANSDVGLIDDPVDLSNRDYLHRTMIDPRQICVGEPIIGAMSGQYVIPVAVGAEDGKGRYFGTMAVSFKFADLSAHYRKISDFYGVDFALLDANNSIIFESKDGIFTWDKKIFNDLSAQRIDATTDYVSPFDLRNRINSYVVVRTSDKYQYRILVGYQNKTLREELALRMFFAVLQFLFITLFFAVTMYYLRRECGVRFTNN